MNIFVLSDDFAKCAEWHVDKHIVKMPLELCQLLSTAHRVLDGTLVNKKWILSDSRENILYSATHINHPCAKWVRESSRNYEWTYNLLLALFNEYSYRYGKVHGCTKLKDSLSHLPNNIPIGKFTEPPQAMPDDVKVQNNVIEAYRNYYRKHKTHLANWKHREIPEWYNANLQVV